VRIVLTQAENHAKLSNQSGGQLRCVIPCSQLASGPVPCEFLGVRPKLSNLPLHVDIQVPAQTSSEAVEQEMLDHGTATGEDLDIMTYGSALPNLRPNIHNLCVLLQLVDHHDAYNLAIHNGSHLLTSQYAHSSTSGS